MSKSNKSLVFFIVGLLFAFGAQAQNIKIGFVNAAKILDKAPQAEKARDDLEKEFAPRDKALIGAQKAVREVEDKLAEGITKLSEDARRELERDLITQKRELKRSQDEFREDFNIRRNEALGKLQRQVYETIVGLGKELGYDLIVNDGAVVYASDKVDITDQVLKRLSEQQ